MFFYVLNNHLLGFLEKLIREKLIRSFSFYLVLKCEGFGFRENLYNIGKPNLRFVEILIGKEWFWVLFEVWRKLEDEPILLQ